MELQGSSSVTSNLEMSNKHLSSRLSTKNTEMIKIQWPQGTSGIVGTSKGITH